MDLNKLTLGDRIIALSAIVLLIASFLPWFEVSVDGGELFSGASADGNGWDVGFLWAGLPVILGLLMLAVVAIRAFSPETNLPDLPITWGQALLGAGVLAAVLVLLKLLIGEDPGSGFDDFVEVSRAWGLFLATLAAIAFAVGGYLRYQEEQRGTAPGRSI